jgi:hypothetical protein
MDRWKALKVRMVEEKGGCCQKCGFTGHPAAFDFHHLRDKDVDWTTFAREISTKSRRNLTSVYSCVLIVTVLNTLTP